MSSAESCCNNDTLIIEREEFRSIKEDVEGGMKVLATNQIRSRDDQRWAPVRSRGEGGTQRVPPRTPMRVPGGVVGPEALYAGGGSTINGERSRNAIHGIATRKPVRLAPRKQPRTIGQARSELLRWCDSLQRDSSSQDRERGTSEEGGAHRKDERTARPTNEPDDVLQTAKGTESRARRCISPGEWTRHAGVHVRRGSYRTLLHIQST